MNLFCACCYPPRLSWRFDTAPRDSRNVHNYTRHKSHATQHGATSASPAPCAHQTPTLPVRRRAQAILAQPAMRGTLCHHRPAPQNHTKQLKSHQHKPHTASPRICQPCSVCCVGLVVWAGVTSHSGSWAKPSFPLELEAPCRLGPNFPRCRQPGRDVDVAVWGMAGVYVHIVQGMQAGISRHIAQVRMVVLGGGAG